MNLTNASLDLNNDSTLLPAATVWAISVVHLATARAISVVQSAECIPKPDEKFHVDLAAAQTSPAHSFTQSYLNLRVPHAELPAQGSGFQANHHAPQAGIHARTDRRPIFDDKIASSDDDEIIRRQHK